MFSYEPLKEERQNGRASKSGNGARASSHTVHAGDKFPESVSGDGLAHGRELAICHVVVEGASISHSESKGCEQEHDSDLKQTDENGNVQSVSFSGIQGRCLSRRLKK